MFRTYHSNTNSWFYSFDTNSNVGHRYYYNTNTGNLDREINALGVETNYTYFEHTSKVSKEVFNRYEYNYNALGNPTEIKVANNTYAVYNYSNTTLYLESVDYENGQSIVDYSYTAYGDTLISQQYATNDPEGFADINPFRYRSYYYDTEVGMYYLQSRYYWTAICRFLNADLPEYAQVQKNDPDGINLFAYCCNDPVNNADPTGYYPLALTSEMYRYAIRNTIVKNNIVCFRDGGTITKILKKRLINSKTLNNHLKKLYKKVKKLRIGEFDSTYELVIFKSYNIFSDDCDLYLSIGKAYFQIWMYKISSKRYRVEINIGDKYDFSYIKVSGSFGNRVVAIINNNLGFKVQNKLLRPYHWFYYLEFYYTV